MINDKVDLHDTFQEILNRIENWINEGSGSTVESIDSRYINLSTVKPLSGSSNIKLSVKLRNSRKELIIIKNSEQKCLLWCHIYPSKIKLHLNPLKIHPEIITEKDKELFYALN